MKNEKRSCSSRSIAMKWQTVQVITRALENLKTQLKETMTVCTTSKLYIWWNAIRTGKVKTRDNTVSYFQWDKGSCFPTRPITGLTADLKTRVQSRRLPWFILTSDFTLTNACGALISTSRHCGAGAAVQCPRSGRGQDLPFHHIVSVCYLFASESTGVWKLSTAYPFYLFHTCPLS